ncbi:MAG: amidohydrolase family protein [Carboxydocellales bacterium]
MPIIDAHVHVMTNERIASGMRWLSRYLPGTDVDTDMHVEKALNMLSDAGVDYYFNFFYPISPGTTEEVNRWSYQLSLRDRRAIPFASLLPADPDKLRLLDQAFDEYNFLGIKLHPYVQKFSIKDPRLHEVYAYLQELNRPVVIHSGYENVYSTTSNRKEILWLLDKYPSLTVVSPHLFYPDLGAAFKLLEIYPQLYLDATNVFYSLIKDKPLEDWWEKFNQFSERIYFGTDFTMGMAFPARLYQQFAELPLTMKSREDLLFRTAWNFAKKFGRTLKLPQVD